MNRSLLVFIIVSLAVQNSFSRNIRLHQQFLDAKVRTENVTAQKDEVSYKKNRGSDEVSFKNDKGPHDENEEGSEENEEGSEENEEGSEENKSHDENEEESEENEEGSEENDISGDEDREYLDCIKNSCADQISACGASDACVHNLYACEINVLDNENLHQLGECLSVDPDSLNLLMCVGACKKHDTAYEFISMFFGSN